MQSQRKAIYGQYVSGSSTKAMLTIASAKKKAGLNPVKNVMKKRGDLAAAGLPKSRITLTKAFNPSSGSAFRIKAHPASLIITLAISASKTNSLMTRCCSSRMVSQPATSPTSLMTTLWPSTRYPWAKSASSTPKPQPALRSLWLAISSISPASHHRGRWQKAEQTGGDPTFEDLVNGLFTPKRSLTMSPFWAGTQAMSAKYSQWKSSL